jgi:NAD(P)-dependent dehydrogenase (short-subunit alcohol dehydrogenase family)
MLTAPIPATAYALKRAGMKLEDIDRVEINEAFASVAMAWLKETGYPHEQTNVNGGAIALGHPLGATGTRLMCTLLHELERSGGRFGLQTMCEGSGQANSNDITRYDDAALIVRQAIETFGGLDVVVNNAGICRDRMFASLTEADWDAVVAVHLKGHFCIASHAARYWREQAKGGAQLSARIINTSSGAGAGLHRPVQLCRCQGRSRYVDAGAGSRTGSLWHNRQRPGPGRAHRNDRASVRRYHEKTRRGLRLLRSGKRCAAGGLARLASVQCGERADVRSRGRQVVDCRRLA